MSGTIFGVQGFSGNRITVPAEDGRLRFWRDTDIAGLAPGTTSALSAATLGYEWDEELDNGARPPGLMHLSTTTVTTSQRMLDVDLTIGRARPTITSRSTATPAEPSCSAPGPCSGRGRSTAPTSTAPTTPDRRRRTHVPNRRW